MKKIYIHIILFLHCILSISAQSLIQDFSHLTSEDGLVGNTINCVTQDKNGFMWVGTNSGLSRYDGYVFKNWKSFSSKAINTVIVNSIVVDKYNNLWVATYGNGLWKYNQATSSFTKIGEKNLIASKNLFTLCMGSDENIYVGSDLGFERISDIYSENPTWEKITEIEDSFDREIMIRSLYSDKENIWLGTFNESIICYNVVKDSFRIYKWQDGNACGSDVMSIKRDRNGRLWAGTWGDGLIVYNPVSDKWENYEKEIDSSAYFNSKIVTDILAASDGNLYISTWGKGMKIIQNGNMEIISWEHSVKHSSGLNNNRLRCLFEDRNGNIWIGTDWEGGVNIYSNSYRNLYHYSLPPANDIDKVLARNFNFSANDDLYVSGNFGVYYVSKDFSVFKEYHSLKKGKYNIVAAGFSEAHKTLILGTESKGIYALHIDHDDLHQIELPFVDNSNISIVQIKIDSTSEVAWIATKSSGIFCYYLKSKKIKLVNSKYVINDLSVNDKGDVWLATKQHGLLKFNSRNYSFEAITSKVNNISNIKRILIAKSGNAYFFAPAVGFLKYSDDTKTIITCRIDKCPIKNVENILEDLQGNIWVSSENELYKVHFDKNSVEFIRSVKKLKHGVFTPNATSVSNDGRFFLGSNMGFYSFYPDKIKCIELPQTVTITNIFINDADLSKSDTLSIAVEELKELDLSYYENSFVFEYSSMDHVNSENTQFLYMLEGFDDKLRVTTKNLHKSTYTNIPPGKYIFKVKALGNENNEYSEIKITIESPIWRKWWAYTIYISGFIFILFVFVKRRELSLKQTNEQLQGEVDKRTQEVSHQNEELAKKNYELEKQSSILEDVIKSKKEKQEEIQQQQEFLQEQNYSIELQHRNILENIDYAKSIQDAVMQPANVLREIFNDSFLLYMPRNVVSGDFYWAYETSEYKVLVVADCTGHGVPGAFMSILGMTLMNELVPNVLHKTAGSILNDLNMELQRALSRANNNIQASDGMDLAMIIYDKEAKKINYAGANNPMYLVRDGHLEHYKPTKIPIGRHVIKGEFVDHYIDILPNDSVYLFSDGYYDQFGGSNQKKFKITPFKELIVKISSLNEDEKYNVLKTTIDDWIETSPETSGNDQTDDIIIVGVRF